MLFCLDIIGGFFNLLSAFSRQIRGEGWLAFCARWGRKLTACAMAGIMLLPAGAYSAQTADNNGAMVQVAAEAAENSAKTANPTPAEQAAFLPASASAILRVGMTQWRAPAPKTPRRQTTDDSPAVFFTDAPFPTQAPQNATPDAKLAMSFYPDEREFVRNDSTLDKMFSGVVQLECVHSNDRNMTEYFTGSVISKDLVLTVAHPFKHTSRDRIFQDCRVLTGDRNDRDGWNEQIPYEIGGVYSGVKDFSKHYLRVDWAIVRIKKEFPDHIRVLKMIWDKENHNNVGSNFKVAHVSYGLDDEFYRGQRQIQKKCLIKGVGGVRLHHDCDNFSGSSGGPLFEIYKEGNEFVPYILGIHVGSTDKEDKYSYKNPAPKYGNGLGNIALYVKTEKLLKSIKNYRGY